MSVTSNNNEVFLDDNLIDLIKKARRSKDFTQIDMAEMLGISSKKYSRIETKVISRIDRDMLKKIADILDINVSDRINNYGLRCSFSLSQDMRNDLEILKLSKGFSSISDTVKYCVHEVINDFFLRKCSNDLLDDLREMLMTTYNNELDKLSRKNEINEAILTILGAKFNINVDEIKKEIEDEIKKRNHADQY